MFNAKGGSAVIPAMRYRDAAAAIEWLVGAFGFEKQLVVPGENGTIRHSQLVFGTGMVMVGSEREGEPADSGGMYVVVEDAAAHHQRAVAAGAELVIPLGQQEDRGLFYACRDLEGRLWNFGEYNPWGP